MIAKTTLKKVREYAPCASGWAILLRSLNKNKEDDEEVTLAHILGSNGLDHALWCLRASDAPKRDQRLYAVWCARQVEHLMTDERSKNALNVAERYANGEATDEELTAAKDTACEATRVDTCFFACKATCDIASTAACAAAMTARNTIGITRAAAEVAAEAARDVARDAQKQKFIEMFCTE